MKNKVATLLLSLLMIVALTACGERETTTSQPAEAEGQEQVANVSDNDTPNENNTDVNEEQEEVAEVEEPGSKNDAQTEFLIGDTWTVDGQWSVTITGVTETADRNEYSDKKPAAVYVVDYVYTNLGYEDDFMDGLYISLDDMIVDNAGSMGYSYPGDIKYYAVETPVGATCQAQECIGVDNPGEFKITVSEYDDNDQKQSATFVVDPNSAPVDFEMPAAGSVGVPALAIGDTWTVDGQWSVTITGVTETTDRNEFSDKNPEAVYIVDYEYTNLGYEDDIMDGLYISLDDMIVDSAGVMGYSYPGNITDYAVETPVGATCHAQECIGVDNAGDFRITISKYDGNDAKQSETFLVTVG